MRIAVNTRLLIKDKLEGIGRFSYETLKRITREHPEHTFYFIFDRPYSEEFIFSDNIIPIVAPPKARHPVLFILWFEFVIPGILKKYNINVFLSPDGYISLRSKIKNLAVIHDINFAHRPKDLPLLVRWYYNFFFPRFARKSTRIATVSEFSKKDIQNTYKITEEKIDVVYNGVNRNIHYITAQEKKDVRDKYAQGQSFFLYVGSLHKRKNIITMLKAFNEFHRKNSNFSLVIAGAKMFGNSEMESCLKNLEFKNKIVFTGRLDNEELNKVQQSAFALLFIPFFEGFGLPVIESMVSGVPVITSNVTALPEIASDAALYVNPQKVNDIVDRMNALVNNQELYKTLTRKGLEKAKEYTWENTSLRLWKSIEKVLQHDA